MDAVTLDTALTSPVLRAVRDYWREKAGEREMPSRSDLDPTEIPRLLPHITLADVYRDPERFRHRLLGTYITTLYERDSTGRWINEELYGKNAPRMLWIYQQIVARRAPVALREALTFAHKDWVAAEGVLMPLAGPDGHVNMAFGAIDVIDGAPPLNEPEWRVMLDSDL